MNTPQFKTHPNAPVVVNWYVVRGGRRYVNRSEWQVKYTTTESAEWMRATMQRLNSDRIYFIQP